jgi:cytoplasmic iron level regulating protein YaaA (DUF328/UPF0246 family)
MISLISPAKNLNYNDPCPIELSSQLRFQPQTKQLANHMKHYEPNAFAFIMKISDKLAQQVFEYYLNFNTDLYSQGNSKQALFAFNGDVYRGIQASTLDQEQCEYAQNHLAILSGLYGLIRPMDLVQPYRLEMGTKIHFENGNLYDFWQKTITKQLNQQLAGQENKLIVNLASNEYIKAVKKQDIKGQWLDIDFKEFKNGQYRTIGIFAKKARGLMVRYILDHKVDDIDALKAFDLENYGYHPELSSPFKLTFTRAQP